HLTTHVKTLHKQGHFGQGIKIAVLDSGIDYTHPALGGCFGDGCKVAYGYDFVGNDFDGIREPVPDNDPKDECSGHGTAVAGIIAAKTTTLVGVVPEAILGAYRIVGCNGETWSSLIKSALEM
ncbi:peptidase S8/S53 domain-containing protein, partial [Syncephalis fuscata]